MKMLLLVLMFCAGVSLAGTAHAAESPSPVQFDSPVAATITPQGALVDVEAKYKARTVDGQKVVDVYVPLKADVPAIAVSAPEGAVLRRWTTDVLPLPQGSGTLGQERLALQRRYDTLQGEIKALKTRVALWENIPGEWTQERLDARETKMQKAFPEIMVALGQKEREAADLAALIKSLPEGERQAKRVRVLLNDDLAENAEVTLRYSYNIDSCTWTPQYHINATREGIHVALEANLSQQTGVDWRNTRVTLLLRDSAQRTPAALRPWRVGKIEVEQTRSRANFAAEEMAAGAAPMAAPKARSAPEKAVAYQSEHATGWQLSAPVHIPQGRHTLPIVGEDWQDTLQRVARPTQGDARVWLLVEHNFEGAPLPAGPATFMLDGSPVGQGDFTPRESKVKLAFGVDPLCSVRVEADTRLRGKEGIINRRQTWQWGWTYIAQNNRESDVSIRIEDAAPQSNDKDIVVTLDDTPPARTNARHELYWDVNVPARGKAEVRHVVRIEAPQDMRVSIGR